MAFMNNLKIKLTLIFPFFLISCGVPGPGTTNVVNRYKDFDSAKAAFDKGVKREHEGKSLATIFDFKENSDFSDFSTTYYVRGLCTDKTKQVSYDDICENIIASSCLVFLSDEKTDICIEFINRCLTSYSSVHLDDVPYEKNLNGLSDEEHDKYVEYITISSILTENRKYEDGDTWPEDYSKFSVEKNEVDSVLKDRYKLLMCDGCKLPFGDILFSKRTSMENVLKYSTAITNFIVSKTSASSN